MIASSLKSSNPLAGGRTIATRASRASVVVRANAEVSTRRAALIATVLGGAALLTGTAEAKRNANPAQESLKTKSFAMGTEASASSYSLDTGIKHRGITPKEKAKILAEVRSKAKSAAS